MFEKVSIMLEDAARKKTKKLIMNMITYTQFNIIWNGIVLLEFSGKSDKEICYPLIYLYYVWKGYLLCLKMQLGKNKDTSYDILRSN